MDPSSTAGASGAVGDTTMESCDWRAQLRADLRQLKVNKIIDALKRYCPFSGHKEPQELKIMAVRFEEKIYTAATSQSDYLRKISLKILTMEIRSQNPMQSNAVAYSVNPSVPLDSTGQAGNPKGGDWQEEVYQKIKAMKDLYLLDLNDLHQKVVTKLQQHNSLPQQPENVQLEKLKVFKNLLEHYIQFLQTTKHGILANYKDKLGACKMQIVNIINANRRKPAATHQQVQA